MDKLKRFLDMIDVVLAPLILFFIFVDVILQIFSRILPGNALPWTLELGEILLGTLIWFGISVAVRNNNHVAFDLVVRNLPKTLKKIAGLLALNLFIVYLIGLGAFTIQLLGHYGKLKSHTTVMDLSMYWVRLPILIGCVASIIRLVIKQYRVIIGKEEVFAAGEHVE